MVKVEKYNKQTKGFWTKGLRLRKDGKSNIAVSFSVAINGRKWNDGKRDRCCACLKQLNEIATTRAYILGKFKFTVIIANKEAC